MICSVYAILSIDYKIECMTGKYSCLCCSIFFDLNKYLLLSAKTQNSIATLSAMPQKALRMIFVNSKPPLSQNKVGSIGPSLASSSIFAPSFSGSLCLCPDVPVYELQGTWNRLSHEENRIF